MDKDKEEIQSDWEGELRKLFELEENHGLREIFMMAKRAKLGHEKYEHFYELSKTEVSKVNDESATEGAVNAIYESALEAIGNLVDYYQEDDGLNPVGVVRSVSEYLGRMEGEVREALRPTPKHVLQRTEEERDGARRALAHADETCAELMQRIRELEERALEENTARTAITGWLGMSVGTKWSDVLGELAKVVPGAKAP